MDINKEEFNLLESLEDIVGQLQMGKMTDRQVLEVLSNIVNYKEEEREDNFNYVCPKCNMSDAITYEDWEGNILDKPICLECDL